MPPSIRVAQPGDLEALLPLMQRLYEEDGLAPFHPDTHRRATEDLLVTPDRGRVHIVEEARTPIGYAVLTWGYSLEFGGRYALLDELYLAPDHRGKGLGRQVLANIEALCSARGIRALRLEVDRANSAAQRLYQDRGFREESRHLFTKWLDGKGGTK